MGNAFGKIFDATLQQANQANNETQQVNISKKNPGLAQYLHMQTQEIMPCNFDGIKFIFNKSLNGQLGMNHIINITNGPENGYRFGTMFTGDEKEWKGFTLPILHGEINTSGHLMTSIIQKFNSIRLEAVAHYEQQLIFPQLTLDWFGNNFTTSLSASKVTAQQYPEFFGCTYLRTVTASLALGVRGYYQLFNNILPIPECLVRYESGPFGWSMSLSPRQMQLCHYLHVNTNLRLGFILNGHFRDKRSIAHFGYQFSCPQKQIIVRGMVDSEWNVRSTVEKVISPLPIIFLLSATLNHRYNRFGLGFGVILNK